MYDNIISRIRTVDEKNTLDTEIETLLASLYENKGEGFEGALNNNTRSWVANEIRTGILKEGTDPKEFLKNLKTEISKFNILTLTLAYEPSDLSIDKLTFFVRQNISEYVILDLIYDPLILGGAEIIYKGEFRDFSLKRLFETEFEEKKKDLLKVLYTR